MTKFAVRFAIVFLLLIPLQAIVFNHLVIFNVAVPLVFLYLIVILPMSMGPNTTMALSFLSGFALDILCDTPGVNSLCCTVLAFSRRRLFHLYVSMDDDLGGRSPSSRTMGHSAFMKFLLTMVFIYCLMLFTIEAFQIFNIRLLLLRIFASTAYTFVLLYAIDSLFGRAAEA